MIDAWIGNLGKYNEGELMGEWVSFPTDLETLQQTFENIGIDGEYEEFFIGDYDLPRETAELSNYLGEYSSLEELNYLATKLDELNTYELEVFEACVGDHVSSIGDAINLTENLDCFILNSDIESQYDLGYYYVNDAGIYDLDSMGTLGNYIDYEAFGRDILLDGNGVLTDYGYLEEVDSMTEIYCDINDIPDEYRLFDSGEEEEHENDLENTELDTEINFNQFDGVRNNLKSEEEKPSILESLKEGRAAVKEANPKEEHTQKKPSKDCDSR